MPSVKAPHVDVIDLWRRVSYLANLPHPVIEAVASVATRHVYAPDQMIFGEGEPSAGLFMVEQGVVKICRYAKDGREHTLLIMQRGDTFNEVPALDGDANAACAVAVTAVVAWRVARSDLQRVTRSHPDLAWALLENIARRTRLLLATVQDLASRNVRGRLAHLLLDQAEAAERGEPPVALTQEEMANRLGTVREVVGRALRSLAAAGIISIERQRIVIIDRARLAEEAEV
jgi:CRP/FNR family transcriptional regulator